MRRPVILSAILNGHVLWAAGLFLMLALTPDSVAQPMTDEFASATRIIVDRSDPALTITSTYTHPDTEPLDTMALRYELTVERTGASTSRTRQGGTFTPTPGDVDTLSTVHLNAQPGDRLHLHLVVRRKGEAIAEATRTEKVPPPE